MKKIIFLDTETTSLEAPHLIQLSFISIDIETRKRSIYSKYFNTSETISFESMSIHHITPKILEKVGVELHEKALEEITDLLKDSWIVAHNANFDRRVLDFNGIITDVTQWIDTYPVAYEIFQEEGVKHNLQYLRYSLWLEFEEEINPHDALSDVIVLEKVYDEMKRIWGLTEEWMKHISDRGIILRSFSFWKYKDMKISDIASQDRGYLEWLYNSESQKPEGQQNENMINTLKHYLF